MTYTISTVAKGAGRGAWSSKNGTLSDDGTAAGRYYRPGVGRPNPHAALAKAATSSVVETFSINDFAVYSAVKGIQKLVGTTADGDFGPLTFSAVKAWQRWYKLDDDGVVGPITAKAMGVSILKKVIDDSPRTIGLTMLNGAVRGHVGIESGWDFGAVGIAVPDDLGLGQINMPSHPGVSREEAFDPTYVLTWMCDFVDGNMKAMGATVSTVEPPLPSSAAATQPKNMNQFTDGIAAYNLGKGGATLWRGLGRPRYVKWNSDKRTWDVSAVGGDGWTDVWNYIYKVRIGG